uniref:G-protein coupled receptors family 1 profile domain-containing protein n=1 Tax=Salvator merianae TaxID=96440 RepID=A0A8D0C5H2_SALMN
TWSICSWGHCLVLLSAGIIELKLPSDGTRACLEKIMITLSVLICVLGFHGNALVFSFLSCTIENTKFTVYILNMAFAELFITFHHISFWGVFLKPMTIDSDVLSWIDRLYIFARNSSFYFLTALSFERYLSVFFPVLYQRYRPKAFSIICCTLLWGLALAVSLVERYSCYPSIFHLDQPQIIFSCNVATIFQMILEFLIFIPIMVFSTFAVFFRMWKKGQVMLDVTIMATVILFLMLEASIRMIKIIKYWHNILDGPVFIMIVMLDSTSNSIKPFVYFAIGWWNRQRGWETLGIYLERALNHKRNIEVSFPPFKAGPGPAVHNTDHFLAWAT